MNPHHKAVRQAAVVLDTVEDLAMEAWFNPASNPLADTILKVMDVPFTCTRDTDEDGDCPLCARSLDLFRAARPSCLQPVHTYQVGPSMKCKWCRLPVQHRVHPGVTPRP